MSIFNYTKINILDTPSYTFTATCFEQTLNCTITWIDRLKKRSLTVLGGNGRVYLQNTIININEPMDFNINAVEDGYDCSVILQHLPDTDNKVDYLNWSRNMFLTVYRITEE